MKRLLIVEDEKFVRDLYKKLLSDTYEITEAENGFEALNLIDNNYDLIILDLNMPVYDGASLLQDIAKRELESKVVIVTAYVVPEDVENLAEERVEEIITKPFNLKEFKDKIEMWLA